jgi:tetratricopeptide (TPR) repeat protein
MFYLLAMALYVKGRLSSGSQRQLCWAGAVSSYLLGLFTKENVVILPLFVALYEFFFFQNVSFSPKGKKALTYVFGAVVLIGLLGLLLWGKRYYEVILEGYKIRDFTLTERVLTQFRVVLYYLTLLIFPIPSRLNLDYDFSISRGLFDPWTTLVSILIVGGLVGLSIWKARRRPLLSFFTLWYFGNLVVESSIFPLEMVYEHRLYLPMVGPVVLFVVGVITGWEKFSERLRLRSRLREDTTRVCGAGATGGGREWPLWGFFSLLVILFVFGSCERNKVWRDAVTLWEDCVKKSPQKPRAHNNLGYYLVKVQNFQRGIEELKFALKLNPGYNDARFNLGVAYGEMNQLDQAETNLEEYLRLAPKDPEGYNEIGLVYLKKKRTKEAVESFKKGMALKPSVAKLHANLGNAYFQLGLIDEAISEFKRAMALHLNLASIHVNLAEAYQKKGRPDLAMQEIEKALRMDPSLNEALVFRGAALVREGKIDQGISELERALKVNPKDPGAYNNLGVAYRKKKRLDEAIVNYKKALDLDPSFSDARINLGEIYFERGQVEAAISEFKNTISFDPRKAEAHNNMGAVYLNKRIFDEAISNFKSALAINPKYGDAHFNLAVAYYYKKDFLSAKTHAEKALELGYEVDPRLLKALGISR